MPAFSRRFHGRRDGLVPPMSMLRHRAHHGAGIVLRCPSCSDVALVIGVGAAKVTVKLRGTFQVAVRP